MFRVPSVHGSFLRSQADRTPHCSESSLNPQSSLLICTHTVPALLSPPGEWEREGQADETRGPRSRCQLCTSHLWYVRNVTPEPPSAPAFCLPFCRILLALQPKDLAFTSLCNKGLRSSSLLGKPRSEPGCRESRRFSPPT